MLRFPTTRFRLLLAAVVSTAALAIAIDGRSRLAASSTPGAALAVVTGAAAQGSGEQQAGGPGTDSAAGMTGDGNFDVLLVELTGEIDVASVYKIQRALREARARGASKVLVRLDTWGGALLATKEIEALLAKLRADEIHTVAFVTGKAVSAGAYIALACTRTFMSQGSMIGAVTPVTQGVGGVQQIPDPDVRHKLISALRASMRALVKARGNMKPWAGKVAEAMVDPDLVVYEVTYEDESGFEQLTVLDKDEFAEFERAGNKIVRRIELSPRPVTLDHEQAEHFGFSAGTYDSVESLVRDEFLVSMDQVGRLKATWSEDAVSWLNGMTPFLFVAGFIMLMIELKTPGFAVPGVLGLLLLGIAMFGSYLVGLAEWFEILLFFLGIALIAVEVFFVPGTLVAGLTGFLCVFFGLILTQQDFVIPASEVQYDILEGNLWNMVFMVGFVIAGSILMWKITPYIPVFNRILQPPPQPAFATGASTQFGGADTVSPVARLVGLVAPAATDLRPAGIVEIDGERYDVVSSGGFVSRGTDVRIVEVHGNRIVVEPSAGAGPEAGAP